jgi:hypothetical protein
MASSDWPPIVHVHLAMVPRLRPSDKHPQFLRPSPPLRPSASGIIAVLGEFGDVAAAMVAILAALIATPVGLG